MKVIIWHNCIDYLLNPSKTVGGIDIQMSYWASAFRSNGWDTYCLTSLMAHKEYDGISLLWERPRRHGATFFVFFLMLRYLLRVKPDLIIARGYSIHPYFLSLLSSIFRFKFLLMIASNNDVDIENDVRKGFQTKPFRKGIKGAAYVVVQNELQREKLKLNFGKDGLIIPNIWPVHPQQEMLREKILWVANFREMKRPAMFLELVGRFPQYNFIMVGGPSEKQLYDTTKLHADRLPNLHFLGKKSFLDVNKLFQEAKLFVCTSSYEGFPNTFLQAWSNGIPVVSTYDANNLIQEKKLGIFCSSTDDLCNAVEILMTDASSYKEIHDNIIRYFKIAHDPEYHYKRIINYVNC